MPDWTKSMQQTFEYYIVDPGTWKDIKPLKTVTSSSISRDSDTDTLGSATFDVTDLIGECYIRTYLVTIQNGVTERFPLGTHLVQTPSSSFDGMVRSVSLDAYTPLLELKENPPPIGYFVAKDENIMDTAYRLVRDNVRAPVVSAVCDEKLFTHFVTNTSDTWMTFTKDLIAEAKYIFDLDELGRILFSPKQDMVSLQPIWTYDESNSSILYPELSLSHDLYGIPNAVELIYTDNGRHFETKVVNDDPNSPISTVNRGREIVYREMNPSFVGEPTDYELQLYAEKLLKELSTIEYTISYTHGYYPSRPGDCVRLNYPRAGLNNVKAKIISQNIKCVPGCPVSEKAVFTQKLWR